MRGFLSCSLLLIDGNEPHVQTASAFLERSQGALAIHLLVELRPTIRVGASGAQRVVDAPGQFCRGIGNRLFGTDLPLLPAVEGSQFRFRIRQRLCSYTQSGCGSIGRSPALWAGHSFPRDLRSRGKPAAWT